MLKEYFLEKVTNSVKTLVESGKLGQMSPSDSFTLQGETPKNANFGDFAVNVSSLARFVKLAPPQIAQIIAAHLPCPMWNGPVGFALTYSKITLELLP